MTNKKHKLTEERDNPVSKRSNIEQQHIFAVDDMKSHLISCLSTVCKDDVLNSDHYSQLEQNIRIRDCSQEKDICSWLQKCISYEADLFDNIDYGSEWPQLKSTDTNGSPRLLIVAASAIRCVELIRELHELRCCGVIGKLFAKHIKIEEQRRFLKQRLVNVGVGTPSRISALIDDGSLKLSSADVILIDCSKDAKERTIFTVPETKKDLCLLLTRIGMNSPRVTLALA